MNNTWEPLARGVYRCRLPFLDVTVGLVTGGGQALLIDCGTTLPEAARIAEDVAELTGSAVSRLVLTHHHFDHILGCGGFGGVPTHAAPPVAAALGVRLPEVCAEAVGYGADPAEVDRAAEAVRIPDHLGWHADIDLGGRMVHVEHPGPGHTDHDLVVVVPPADPSQPVVVFCGDLVEESAEPAIGPDSHLAAWPSALDRILELGGEDAVYVPGHGAVVDAEFLRAQRDWLVERTVSDRSAPNGAQHRAGPATIGSAPVGGRQEGHVERYDIAIIGTGSGNSVLDQRYADKKVAICEQGVFGGTCLNVGCIPTKMFVYAAEVAQNVRGAARFGVDAHLDGVRWSDIVSRVFGRIDPLAVGGEHYRRSSPNVTVYASHTRFAGRADGGYRLRTDDGDEFIAAQVVIAAGSRAAVPEAVAGCGVDYHTSDTIMRIAELPKHLVIVGGGFVAAEFAHVFSALGSRITLVIRGGTMLSHCDDTVCERFTDIAGKKWEIRSHRSMVGAHQDGAEVVVELDDSSTVRADAVLVATGRIPNADRLDADVVGVETRDGRVVVDEYQRTTARDIFALGDVSSPYQLKHVANHEARVVRHNLLQRWDDTDTLMPSDHRFVPSAVFTDPQIATVGLTENQARAAGFDIMVKVQDYADVAYGWAMEDTTGFAKVIVERDTGLILGAHIMGHQASSLIQPLIQAMSFGLAAQDMARGQYWIHPALPEVIENALLALCGEPSWPPSRRH